MLPFVSLHGGCGQFLATSGARAAEIEFYVVDAKAGSFVLDALCFRLTGALCSDWNVEHCTADAADCVMMGPRVRVEAGGMPEPKRS